MPRRDDSRILDMIESSNAVLDIVRGRDFNDIADPSIARQPYWLIFVIGEAATNVSNELRGRHPEAGWTTIARTRNRVGHGYFDIDDAIIDGCLSM